MANFALSSSTLVLCSTTCVGIVHLISILYLVSSVSFSVRALVRYWQRSSGDSLRESYLFGLVVDIEDLNFAPI